MSDEIKPVLTPEQWARVLDEGDLLPEERELGPGPMSTAAIWLHENKWFTWGDVDTIRALVDRLELEGIGPQDRTIPLGLADRIAALLPPRE